MSRRRIFSALGLCAAFSLSACATPDQIVEGPDRIADTPIEERAPSINMVLRDAVNFFAEDPITLLESGEASNFRIEAMPSEPVPDVLVREINAAPLEFGAILSLISDQTGRDWRVEGADADNLMSRPVFFVQRSPSSLGQVLTALGRLTDSFWRIEDGRIIFSNSQRFFARAPRMVNSLEIISNALTGFGAQSVFTDPLTGTITFTATREAFDAANRMFESFERGRDMIVYDFWLLDRNLTDNAGLGIDLEAITKESAKWGFNANIAGGSALEGIVGSASTAGVTGAIGAVDLASTLTFIRSLGQTETISRPTISMLSGADSQFELLTRQSYIREITRRALNTTTVNAETGNLERDTETATTVEDLETGLTIEVTGAYSSGVISSQIKIDVSELLAFEDFDTGDVTLRLPRTFERSVTVNMEARPGDVMVLAGIIRERESRRGQEIVVVGAPTARGTESEKVETIIFVRPRLVQIRNTAVARPTPPSTVSSDSGSGLSSITVEEDQARALIEALGVDQ